MSHADTLDTDILTFLERHERKELLRFVSVGSVDDGKSTLIGRLLHDTEGVYEDQLQDATTGQGDEAVVDFARITDGLRAEREQGITIDVAYRYFTTANRKYIIADTPGHIQYTRNMATGASTADVGIILIDARLGVLNQSKRHAFIASLLGIPKLLVAINKMDLVDYDPEIYARIKDDFAKVAAQLNFDRVDFIPMSALMGVNVVQRGEETAWYSGPTFLEYLETIDISDHHNMGAFRYPVQCVIRPHLDYRGFAGQVVSGEISPGDAITVLPSGKRSRVAAVDTYGGEVERAFTPMSVTLRLEDEIDISRGDMIVKSDDVPTAARRIDMMVVWMSESALDPSKQYIVKHTTRYVRAQVQAVHWRIDLNTLKEEPTEGLQLNDIGRITLDCHQPLYFDPYTDNRMTGALVIIDTLTNDTVAAAMVCDQQQADLSGERLSQSHISATELQDRLAQQGRVIGLRGEDEAHELSVAYALERRLFERGWLGHAVDPEDATSQDRVSIADTMARAGLIAIISLSGQPSINTSDARPESKLTVALGETSSDACEEKAFSLPATIDPFEAADAIITQLLERGILLPHA